MVEQQSLRTAVGKWLGHTRTTVRVLTVHRSRAGRIVGVCVAGEGPRGPCELFFFHHTDRGWQVFPPSVARPSMAVERLAM
ncbi:hypothetical protein EVC45_14145 [Paraburkholderia sp. UYCP14C]|uniref:hypothetical protein n=1 Tax=Paraburkholderia sp. UYCP14C TaxID=2511130 RepID=UPI0010221B42|nr:hypothetical protein [Paraburkholderia sp. UYCP14C]RZF29251.1 hypothetical protein EVC45_14145 [Paraburkholderia sp. UYCP14C]